MSELMIAAQARTEAAAPAGTAALGKTAIEVPDTPRTAPAEPSPWLSMLPFLLLLLICFLFTIACAIVGSVVTLFIVKRRR